MATDADAAATQPNRLRQGFVALAETLLRSVAEVFPECEATEAALQLFSVAVKGDEAAEDDFVRRCAALFGKHAAALQRKEDAGLFAIADSLSILRDVDLRSKWADPGFTQESKEHLWQYLLALKTYAELYCALPCAVMGKIERVAGGIGERLRSGELNLASMDIATIGNELLGQLSQEELRDFEGGLPRIFESISQVASSVAAQAGHSDFNVEALMRTLVESQQQDGAEQSAASVLQAMGGLLAPGGASAGGIEQLLGLVGGGGGRGAGAMGALLRQMAAQQPQLQDNGAAPLAAKPPRGGARKRR
jgi:hypothetical protein